MVSIIHAMDYASQVKLQHFFLFSTDDNFTEQQYVSNFMEALAKLESWARNMCKLFSLVPSKKMSPGETETS